MRLLGWTILVVLIFASAPAGAIPVEPDPKLLLEEAEKPPKDFAPTRAGWDGPEMLAQAEPNPLVDSVHPAVAAAEFREALLMAAIPDWRLMLTLLGLVLVLRKMRELFQPVPIAAKVETIGRPEPERERRAA